MRLILLAGMIALATPALAYAQGIGGLYTVDGTNFDGSPYGGTAEIVPTGKTTCDIYWTTGPTTSSGICMRKGNVFSAGYTLDGSTGLVVYEIMDDGSMKGIWTVAGQSGSGTETLTPQ